MAGLTPPPTTPPKTELRLRRIALTVVFAPPAAGVIWGVEGDPAPLSVVVAKKTALLPCAEFCRRIGEVETLPLGEVPKPTVVIGWPCPLPVVPLPLKEEADAPPWPLMDAPIIDSMAAAAELRWSNFEVAVPPAPAHALPTTPTPMPPAVSCCGGPTAVEAPIADLLTMLARGQ